MNKVRWGTEGGNPRNNRFMVWERRDREKCLLSTKKEFDPWLKDKRKGEWNTHQTKTEELESIQFPPAKFFHLSGWNKRVGSDGQGGGIQKRRENWWEGGRFYKKGPK